MLQEDIAMSVVTLSGLDIPDDQIRVLVDRCIADIGHPSTVSDVILWCIKHKDIL